MASGKRIRDVSVSDEDTDREGSLFDDSPSETSKEGEQAVKRQQMDNSQTSQSLADRTIRCSLPPHADMDLPSYHAYEVHYEQYHLHRCSECLKNFPSDHYLQLHITENHDPITALKKERGERTFACFVEDCDRKCSTAQKRRMHIIDKHGFPKLYDFFIVNDGIDRRTSMLRQGTGRRRRPSEQKSAGTSEQGAQTQAEAEVLSLTKSMSALKFIPRNVKFGKGASKTFTR